MPRLVTAPLVVAALFIAGCPDATDAPSGTTSTGSTGTTTGPPPPDPDCVDPQQGNDSQFTAHPVPDSTAAVEKTELEGKLCGGSDWFHVAPACDAFMGVEVHVVDDSGEVALTLRDNFQTIKQRTQSNDVQIQAIHRPVSPQDYWIEVAHVSGDPVEYELVVYTLPNGSCTSASYLCEGDVEEIEPTKSSCLVFPTGGSCPPSRTHTDTIDLPDVSDGESGWTSGWAIHVDGSEVRNHDYPTAAELSLLEDRCIEACEAEWADVPEVEADCDAAGAFSAITLLDTPSLPSQTLIDAADQDGSGLFASHELACNLHTTCCEAFASHLCPLRPDRVTPSPPLIPKTREQFSVSVDGLASFQGGAESTTLSGDVRWSDADPDFAAPRPVYVSSVSFDSDTPVTLELDCNDGTEAEPEVEIFGLWLLQPAFGIRQTGTSNVAFPPGAFVYRLGVMVDSVITWVQTHNQLPLYASLSSSGLAVELVQVLRVPCNTGTAFLELDMSLDDDTLVSQPPAVTIDIASTVSCPGSVSLDATVTDPESDVQTIDWYVGDVLLEDTLTSIGVPSGVSSIDFAVVACDSREACTRAEKTVTCI